MGRRQLQTCFISAPRSVDTTPLREALSARGVRSWDVGTMLAGSHVQQTVESVIADADFVCGVIPDGPSDPNVVLELGVAIGAGRPLLLFVAPKAELPASLRGRSYARASLKDEEALRFHLDAFLKNAGKTERAHGNGRRQEERPASPGVIKAALDQLAAWESQPAPPHERDIVEYLANLFEAMGWVASAAPTSTVRRSARADLAVWVDELYTVAGNPLQIEVVGPTTSIVETVHRFQRVLLEFQSLLGLLVRWRDGGESHVPDDWRQPIVVVMGVRELVEALGRGDFARAVLSRRNAAVHSAA